MPEFSHLTGEFLQLNEPKAVISYTLASRFYRFNYSGKPDLLIPKACPGTVSLSDFSLSGRTRITPCPSIDPSAEFYITIVCRGVIFYDAQLWMETNIGTYYRLHRTRDVIQIMVTDPCYRQLWRDLQRVPQAKKKAFQTIDSNG